MNVINGGQAFDFDHLTDDDLIEIEDAMMCRVGSVLTPERESTEEAMFVEGIIDAIPDDDEDGQDQPG